MELKHTDGRTRPTTAAVGRASKGSDRHDRRLLLFHGGVACALETRLRQLCPGLASSVLIAAFSCFECQLV